MEYTTLTGTGMTVSRLCLGTMTFGEQMAENECIRAVDYALDAGVTFFDTANRYTNGASETILGKALMGGKREKAIVATKVGNVVTKALNNSGSSRLHIMKQVDISLKRLHTDYIDIYYLHSPDPKTPVEETLDAMDCLVRSGKVRYIGTSNFAAWQACRLTHIARETNRNAPVVTQMCYNMITRGIEQEFIPFVQDYKQGLVIFNPIAAGILTEKYAAKQKLENSRFSFSTSYANRYWNEDNLNIWDDVHTIAQNAGISMLDLAMRWVYSTGHVDAILTGFSSMAQLEQNLKSLDAGALDAELMQACDGVWKKLAGTRHKYNR